MIAYFDCFSGISGDMTLGALVDAGVPLTRLRTGLSRLPLRGYQLTEKKVTRAGLRATKVDVIIKQAGGPGQGARKWKDIRSIIQTSSLSKPIKQKGLSVFKRLFEAEARVHGSRYDRVHLHELGAIDCIVDIFGSLIGLDILGIHTVHASPVNLGSGSVMTAHGLLPVPAPASAELLKGIPVYSSPVAFELTTPTGAALISSLAAGFGPMPEINISKIGVGAGNKDFREQPNILRIMVGKGAGKTQAGEGGIQAGDMISVIETNIDDMNPQIYDYLMERLFRAGALDVFLTQIMMKKNRPGITLTVLSDPGKRDEMIDIILRETTSIGLRFYSAGRKVLERTITSKNTKYGTVKVKVSKVGSSQSRMSAEYEDCRKIAKKFDVPLLEVIKAVARNR